MQNCRSCAGVKAPESGCHFIRLIGRQNPIERALFGEQQERGRGIQMGEAIIEYRVLVACANDVDGDTSI